MNPRLEQLNRLAEKLGYRVETDPDGIVTMYRPDGSIMLVAVPPNNGPKTPTSN